MKVERSKKEERKVRKRVQKIINHSNKALDRLNELEIMTSIPFNGCYHELKAVKRTMLYFAEREGLSIDEERRA